MADTLIEEGAPPTVRDESLEAPEPPPPPPRRATWPAYLAMILTALACAGALAYELWLRHAPVARRHVPSNANLALHVEAADLALFAPARAALLPVLEEALARPSDPGCGGPARPRGERLEAATGARIERDTREIVVASVDAKGWVVVLAGGFPRGRFVDGLAKVLSDEGELGARKAGGLLVLPSGAAVGQADDGSIVLGSDASLVQAALPATDDAAALGLPDGGGVTFAMTERAWSGASDALGRALPHTSLAPGVARATGKLTLGASPRLELRLEPSASGLASPMAERAEAMLAALREATAAAPDVAGEKEALRQARVTPLGAGASIEAPWPSEGLERGFSTLAGALRPALAP